MAARIYTDDFLLDNGKKNKGQTNQISGEILAAILLWFQDLYVRIFVY